MIQKMSCLRTFGDGSYANIFQLLEEGGQLGGKEDLVSRPTMGAFWASVYSLEGPHENFQIWAQSDRAPSDRAVRTRTPTERIPNLFQQPHGDITWTYYVR